uniref:hypothetical protein n=1 Tax=Ornithobacterium rhinotracheale TaxID=28251 RepID=UPI00129D1FFD|nr:hypothetical protein [Ornithobacterium rhinotracheale]
MKTFFILLAIVALFFFPYVVLNILIVAFGLIMLLAFFNLFYMIITGKGTGKYDKFN